MNKEELKAKMTGISFLSTGSQDFETGDKCLVNAATNTVRNDYKVAAPTPGLN